MQIIISRKVPLKYNYSRKLTDLLLIMVAIPVLVISLISIGIYYAFSGLWSLLAEKPVQDEKRYYLEIPLVKTARLDFRMIEDEMDDRLTAANEAWIHHVYDEDSYFFRIKTIPVIAGLEDQIAGFYFKETDEGVLLQLLKDDAHTGTPPNTRLVFVNKENLQLTEMDTVGPYFLYNDPKDIRIIHGMNKKERIELLINP